MRIGYANIAHCFPEMSEKERRAIVRESVCRMIEMGMFILASPYMSLEKLKPRVKIDKYVLDELSKHVENPYPVLILLPHLCMSEAVTLMPALVDVKLPPVGVIYRPFENKSTEEWVKQSRQRCGLVLLSRRNLRASIDFLKRNGAVALMIDQHAGRSGVQTLFFDRICSTTDLPRILVEHKNAHVAFMYAKRTGFWHAEIKAEWLNTEDTSNVAGMVNLKLENLLRNDAEVRKDWLWLHRRWERINTFSMPKMSKSEYDKCLQLAGGEFKRLYRYAVTLPSSLRGTLALIPLIKALRESRPDAYVSVICENRFFDVISSFNFADEVICAPNSANVCARVSFFRKLRYRYFDTHIVIENSFLADLESKMLMPQLSLAIQSKGRKRKFINKVYNADYASEAESLLSYYEAFFRKFGLIGVLDISPLDIPIVNSKNKIAIVCGGSGNHALSAKKWGEIIKALDKKLQDYSFVVLGDECDCRAAYDITRVAEYAEIRSEAGKLSDSEMMSMLKSCSLVIGTDCRLTHIANALGCTVVAVYGPTNPLRNGLVFDAPKTIVRPRNSPIQGGTDVENVSVDDVVLSALNFLNP